MRNLQLIPDSLRPANTQANSISFAAPLKTRLYQRGTTAVFENACADRSSKSALANSKSPLNQFIEGQDADNKTVTVINV